MTSILRRLPGPALISGPVLGLVVAWSAALNLLGAGTTVTGGTGPRAAAAAVAGACAGLVVIASWFIVIRRISGAMRVTIVAVTLLLAGFARGASLQLLLVTFNLAEDTAASASVRLATSVVTTPAAFVIGAAAWGAVLTYRSDAAALIAEQQQLGHLLELSERGLYERRTEAVHKVQAQLDEQIAQLPIEDAPATVGALESLAGDVVRPLSHQLARDLPTWSVPATEDVPHVPWADVFRAPDASQAIRPRVLVLVMGIIGLPGAVFVYSPIRGLIALAGALGVLAVCLSLGRQWLAVRPPRTAPEAWSRIVLVLAGSAVVSAAMVALLDIGARGQGAFWRLALVAVPVFGLLVAIVSMLGSRMRGITSELATVNRDLRWALARVNIEAWEQGGRLSRALHGPVQSLLHARMLSLRKALDAGDTAVGDVAHLRDDLQRSLAAALAPSSTQVAVESVLRDVSKTWAGVADVIWHVDADASSLLASDSLCAEAVADIATEAVSNSVRHGGATGVSITIDVSEHDLIRVRVVDDGTAGEGVPGLGTVLLTRCAFDWSLSHQPPTTLTVRLPIQVRERVLERS